MTKKQWRDTWRSVRTIASDLVDDAERIGILHPSQCLAWHVWLKREAANKPIKTPAQKLAVEW